MDKFGIILAAGNGKRLGMSLPKCLAKIDNRFMFEYSLYIFTLVPVFKKIILVVPQKFVKKLKFTNKKIKVIAGGKTRNESFENAVAAIGKHRPSDKIVIHDAARIFLTKYDLLKLVNSKEDFGTLCYIGEKNKVDCHIGHYNIQTPQFCRFSVYDSVKTKNKNGKDLFTYLKLKPRPRNFYLCSNAERNFKITFKNDLEKAKECFK